MFETLNPLTLTLNNYEAGSETDFGMEAIIGLETFEGLQRTPSFEKHVGNIKLDASFGLESIIDGSMFESEDDLVVPDDCSVGDDGLLSFEQIQGMNPEGMNPVKDEFEDESSGAGAGQLDFVLPPHWDDDFLDMKSAALNRLLKQKKLAAEEQKEIKLARRRLLNRRYAKKSRTKKLKKWSNLEVSHSDVRDTNSSLYQEVEELKSTNHLMERRMAAMYDLLLKAGCMTREQVESALQAAA